jgi:hypothetical protein
VTRAHQLRARGRHTALLVAKWFVVRRAEVGALALLTRGLPPFLPAGPSSVRAQGKKPSRPLAGRPSPPRAREVSCRRYSHRWLAVVFKERHFPSPDSGREVLLGSMTSCCSWADTQDLSCARSGDAKAFVRHVQGSLWTKGHRRWEGQTGDHRGKSAMTSDTDHFARSGRLWAGVTG